MPQSEHGMAYSECSSPLAKPTKCHFLMFFDVFGAGTPSRGHGNEAEGVVLADRRQCQRIPSHSSAMSTSGRLGWVAQAALAEGSGGDGSVAATIWWPQRARFQTPGPGVRPPKRRASPGPLAARLEATAPRQARMPAATTPAGAPVWDRLWMFEGAKPARMPALRKMRLRRGGFGPRLPTMLKASQHY